MVGLRWPYGVGGALAVLSATIYNWGASTFGCWISFSTRFHVILAFPLLLAPCFLLAYYGARYCHRCRLHCAYRFGWHQTSRQSKSLALQSRGSDKLVPLLSARDETSTDPGIDNHDVVSELDRDIQERLARTWVAGPLQATPSSEHAAKGGLLITEHDIQNQLRRRQFFKRSYVSFLAFFYSAGCNQALSIFDCEELQGELRLRAFAAIACYDEEWYRYMVVSVLALVVYGLGIPALILSLLKRANWGHHDAEVEKWFGVGLLQLKPNRRWWDVLSMVWRLVAVMVVLLPRAHGTRVGLLCAVLAVQSLALYKLRPSEAFLVYEELVLLCCTFTVSLCSLGFDQSPATDTDTTAALYAIAMLALIIMVCIIGLGVIRVALRQFGSRCWNSCCCRCLLPWRACRDWIVYLLVEPPPDSSASSENAPDDLDSGSRGAEKDADDSL